MGTRDRALNDCEILGLRAGRECGSSLDGTIGGSQTFTAVTYRIRKHAMAGRLTGRDIAGFMVMAGGVLSSGVPYMH